MTMIRTDSAYLQCLARKLDHEVAPEIVKHRERLDAIADRLAAPVAAAMPNKLPIPPAPVDALEVVYAEGWNACCEAFFGGKPALEPIVITVTEQAAPVAAPRDQALEDAARYRWIRDCADPDDGQVHCSIHKQNDWGNWVNEWATGEALDETIDADMTAAMTDTPNPQAAPVAAGELSEDIKIARQILARLCENGLVSMSVPVRQSDEDMVLSRVIKAAAFAVSPTQQAAPVAAVAVVWQLIGTAPENGVLSLFCDMNAVELRHCYFVDWMVSGKFCGNRQAKATHWMMLPREPSALQSAAITKDKP